jgi:hypothetical protein
MVSGIDVGTVASISPREDGVGLSSILKADGWGFDDKTNGICNHGNTSGLNDVQLGILLVVAVNGGGWEWMRASNSGGAPRSSRDKYFLIVIDIGILIGSTELYLDMIEVM